MPFRPGSFIETTRGTRRLLNDKLAKGLGIPKAWLEGIYPHTKTIWRTPAVHLLEYIGQLLQIEELSLPTNPGTSHRPAEAPPPNWYPPFTWKPPDMGPTSNWTRERVFNLIRACVPYENPGVMIANGLQDLRCHRSNYDLEGPRPTHLQLL
jgi:hypothetical protein